MIQCDNLDRLGLDARRKILFFFVAYVGHGMRRRIESVSFCEIAYIILEKVSARAFVPPIRIIQNYKSSFPFVKNREARVCVCVMHAH